MPLLLLALLAVQQPRPDSMQPSPYWQQAVAYHITAKLDEPTGVIAGTERINYVNHSPDTLTTFSLHLHLNAFRPGSRWSDADSVEGRRRFNDLKDPDYGFNHVRDVRIMGQPVTAIWPLAPDSTIVRFELPRPLLPGDSMVVEMNWDGRPSTVPRRQGRQGRRFDFAQWYPKVVVYDRYGWEEHALYPGGEFYGEFATFLVDLDVPEDQVIGATGVPLCGDPGWARTAGMPDSQIEYQRHYYADAPRVSCDSPGPGRKRVIWYAEQVHHFAMSLNPDYHYEQGRFGDVAVHVLYQPGDTATWGGGIAVKRTEIALAWLDQLYGKFAWPQMTNVHRIEGGGTEFPMMVMNGSADQGLIVHEVGHNYTMGILANNEWREGFMDEGFTSFQTQWFWETAGRSGQYQGLENFLLQLSLQGMTEPTSLVSEDYRDFTSYNLMIYSRGQLFFDQLRYVVGDDVMHRILQTFYRRWKLRHVDENAFRAVAEEVSGRDLSTLFGQWLHSADLYDYAVGRVRVERAGNGYRTHVEVVRREEGRIPVEVAVVAGSDTAMVRTDGLAERAWVEVPTTEKPTEVIVDPRVRTHDWNMLNNRRQLGFHIPIISDFAHTDIYLDPFFSERVRRDRLAVGLAPTVWFNDAGGITVGLRERDNYLGMFDQNRFQVSYGTGWSADPGPQDLDLDVKFANPTWWRSPGLSQSIEAFRMEGRAGVWAALEKRHREHLSFGPETITGLSLGWTAVTNTDYIDPGYWDDAGTIEFQFYRGIADRLGPWSVTARGSVGGGMMYATPGPGLTTENRYDAQAYFRGTLEATARRSLGAGFALAARGFAGYADGKDDVVRQRRIYLAGGDPYQQLSNPFLRSRGALLVRPDENYHFPGGADMRGYDPHLSATQALALNLQVEKSLLERPRAGLFRRVALTAFGDIGWADGAAAIGTDHDMAVLGDAGVGIQAEHRLGQTIFTTRVDLPLYVSREFLAQDRLDSRDKVGFRWLFSFAPAW
ncbi:MAG TPA: M1 family metallopeptidase [Gemmatimonadales bacterium]|nr:M1 family metallopeptidase [Gemmatimonadales bacterium]